MMDTKVHFSAQSAPPNNNAPPGGASVQPTSGTSEQRRRELADFLRTRREKLKPEQVGISQGSRRRTPGLRREEVAELAGVGTTWYTWLEQARDIQPSVEVLRRLSQALQLNPAELRHMFSLAGKAPPNDAETTSEQVSEAMQRFLNDALQVPAILLGGRWDILAMNKLAEKEFPYIAELPAAHRNWLYYVFCTPRTRVRLGDTWEANARRLLAEFRLSVSDSLDNPWVLEVVEAVKKESPEFTSWWREHDVRDNSSIVIEINDPDSGPRRYERAVLKPWDNMRYKIFVYTPLPK